MHLNSQSADGQIEGKLEVKSIKSNRKNRQDQHNEYGRTDSLNLFYLFIYFKIRSLTCKTEELRAWISTWNLDIVTMTEIWLKEGQDWQSTF